MTSIIRKCSELSTSIKFGISGTCTGLCYAFGATNPVTLVAMAAIPFLPSLMSRCMRDSSPRLAQAVPIRGQPLDDALDEKALQRRDMIGPNRQPEDLDAASARLIEQIMRQDAREIEGADKKQDTTYDIKEPSLKKAVAASLNPIAQVYTCPYAKALNGDDSANDAITPPALLLEKEDKKFCNLANFMLTLLLSKTAPSDPESRDMLGNDINIMDIQAAALMLGIDYERFLGIWTKATVTQAAIDQYFLAHPNDDPDMGELMSDLLRDARIKLFKNLIQRTQTPTCRTVDAFCRETHGAIWNKP